MFVKQGDAAAYIYYFLGISLSLSSLRNKKDPGSGDPIEV